MQGILVMTTEGWLLKTNDTSFGISLYIYGDTLEPEFLSNELGLQPIRSHRKGYIREAPSGKIFTAKTGFWEFSTCAYISSMEVNDHLEFLIENINKTSPIYNISGVQNAYIGIYISVDHETCPTVEFEIKPSTFKKISSLDIPVKFTFV